jgi:DNA-binding transcriptional ArsR family regulator
MVKYSTPLDTTFGALSDATRRGILARLALGETCVSELAAPYDMSLPAVSKHLRVLEHAGLLVRHRDGRARRCRLVAKPMKDASEWIERYREFWTQQFDALARYLDQTKETESTQCQRQTPGPHHPSRSGASFKRQLRKSSRRGRNENS